MGYLLGPTIESMSQVDLGSYWWYAVRYFWIKEAVAYAARNNKSLRLMDLGCGTGGLLLELRRNFDFENVLGADGDDRVLEIARNRGISVCNIDFEGEWHLPFKPNVIVCADVLEHIADDRRALGKMRSACEPGSFLIVTVPAFSFLYSGWDRHQGHHRRYTKKELAAALEKNRWRILKLNYFYSFLLPIMFLQRKVLKKDQTLEFPEIKPWLNRLLTSFGALERGFPLPFGTSVFCLAQAC